MTTINYINISLEIWGCVVCVIVGVCLFLGKGSQDLCRRLYFQMLACNIGALFFDVMALLFRGHPGAIAWWGVRASNLFSFSCNYLMLICFVHYLTVFLEQRIKVSHRYLLFSRIICAISLCLLVLTQFFPIFYYIDSHNVYHRAELFWVSQAAGIVGMFLCAHLLARYRKALEAQERNAFWIYIILPAVALSVQIFSYGIVLLGLANTISLVVIFLFLQAEQGRRIAEQEKELAQKNLELSDSRVKLLLAQIQPHFIFNSLLAIQELCAEDPPKAEQAVQNFSKYLRGNLDAMSCDRTIPFAQELEHIRHYLALEQADPASRLNVIYDLEATDFEVPPLSVQPIVENAVRHGIGTRSWEGTVTIATRREPQAIRITVQDDGAGFTSATAQQNQRRSVGIENVRTRLSAQCGGSLDIQTGSTGTAVIITIPEGEK